MAGRTVRCNGCRVELIMPVGAKSIRCAVCQAVTPVRPNDPIQQAMSWVHHRANEPVRQATTWVKGLISHVSYNMNSYASTNCSGEAFVRPTYSSNAIVRPPTYFSAHGKKRALLCGICYRSRRYELKGSINDVNCMRFLLRDKFGFPDESILVLTENERDPYRIPTKQNIRTAMYWLVKDCSPGDSLVFHYSGHGSQQPNFNGDEIDGRDETLCPLDYEVEGMIIDDEINAAIVRPLKQGVKLHAIIDACHSGTVLDLPYLCRMSRGGSYKWENHIPPSGSYKGTSGGLAISFSGCDDHQTSADTTALSGDTMTGAMTYSFIQAMESGRGMTYGSMLSSMHSAIRDATTGVHISGPIASLVRRVFRAGLSQEPQLSSSKQFEIYSTPFVL